jgi:hypothetical protein
LEAKEQAQVFIEEYREIYPALVECVEKDLDACIVYMNHPPNRWKHTCLLQAGKNYEYHREKFQGGKAACKGDACLCVAPVCVRTRTATVFFVKRFF